MWSARLTCPTGHTTTWEASARVNGDGRSMPVLNLLVSVWILLNGSLFGPTQVDGIEFMYPGKIFHFRPSSSLSGLASCLSPLTIGPCPISSTLWYGSSGSYTGRYFHISSFNGRVIHFLSPEIHHISNNWENLSPF